MNQQKSRILAHSLPTNERLLRRRWAMAGVGCGAFLSMMGALALAPSGGEGTVQLQTVLEQLATAPAVLVEAEAQTFLREESIQRSDTVSTLLTRLGISDTEALEFLRKAPEVLAIARQLRPGKTVAAKTTEYGGLVTLYFPLNGKDAMLVIERSGEGFVVSEQVLDFETQTVLKSGEIKSSLFGATDAVDIPDAIATQLAEIFSADIDFHRDLRKGDRFSLVYETESHRGQPVRSGRILTAEFINDQKTYSAFWYQAADGKGGYFTADGKNLRKAFLRSPLEFSRVTSGFSSARVHPVLKVSRAHKGIDYGAPTGTRVRAVADATVEFAGRRGGYGNLIVLKHQGTYSTAYGHLNGFAAGLRIGSKVNQGDTIGYVGQTGLTTGPHLHYEFRVNAQQVNPLAVSLPVAFPLQPSQIVRFKAAAAPLGRLLGLAKQINLAKIQ